MGGDEQLTVREAIRLGRVEAGGQDQAAESSAQSLRARRPWTRRGWAPVLVTDSRDPRWVGSWRASIGRVCARPGRACALRLTPIRFMDQVVAGMPQTVLGLVPTSSFREGRM